MRAGHPSLQAETLGLIGKLLDMARQRIVGLVAMHIDHQAAFGGDLAKLRHRARAVGHGALEMRNAANDVDAHVQRANGVFKRRGRAIESILRKGDQLQVDIGRDRFLDIEQRLDGEQPIVADIDVAAYGKQAHRHRPVAIGERPIAHGFMRQQRLQLAPQSDTFEQRAGGIDAGDTVGKRGVHMEVRIDEGWRDEIATRVDLAACRTLQFRLDRRDGLAGDADIGNPAVRQRAAAHNEVEIHLSSSPWYNHRRSWS